MQQCCKCIRSLRYKLRMTGIHTDSPAYILGDNKSVLVNSSVPTLVLRKKSTNEWRVAYVNTHHNVAELLTELIPNGKKGQNLIDMVLHYVF